MVNIRALPSQLLASFEAIPLEVNERVVYLRDDLCLFADPFCEEPLVEVPTSEWVEFCSETLGVRAPFSLHPKNQDFVWQPLKGPFRILTEEQAKEFDEFGWTTIPNAFSSEELTPVIAEIDRLEADVESAMRRLQGGKAFIGRAGEISFSSHLVKRSRLLRDFVSSRVYRNVAYDIVGPNVRLYWDHAVYKKPGVSKPFPWHQDNGYTFVAPQQYLTTWLALGDADESNGCMWAVPGLHRLGTFQHRETHLGNVCFETEPRTAIPLPAKAGSLIVMAAVTPHQTGPNLTRQVRKGYVVQFAPTGAVALTDSTDGKEIRTPAEDSERQFSILVNGEPALT